ncbi:HIT family protein [Bacillus thermotolerans]|uniref:Histidine triad (HIT) nucleotide-binding protein n=1 Tax=Bacillus thermotolerans TaxID=1221996 RepID=A0A0F5HTT9_BACTR|nr:HIT family protein [Bacillus thermotolerans]KKB36799.1 Histidine triad (HIT) nucleotide-binding protein [Bacillus thermotolerans]KKB40425.1 Histidine triad (HIT) nucleotide-binding protein [Bacillus thermotolerans]
MSDCIFCKIIDGEIPSAKVYEDEEVYAFLDISQVTKGHTLIIPKKHKENIFEFSQEEAGRFFERVPLVAEALKSAFQPEGLNILNNNGATAGQTVFHSHIHLIPRYGREDGFHPVFKEHNSEYTSEDLQQIAKEIAAHL